MTNQPTPKSITPPAIPDPEQAAAYQDNLAAEIRERALVLLARSYRGGSRSEFYDNCTRNCIAALAGALASEIVLDSTLRPRSERKVAGASIKALVALQTSLASLLEDGGDARGPLYQDPGHCEPEEGTATETL